MRRQRQKGSRAGSRGTQSTIDETSCVAEIMGTELFTLTPDTMVGSALRLASTRRIQHFLVIEDKCARPASMKVRRKPTV